MSCINYSTTHNVAVAIGTRLRAGRPRNRSSISGTGKRILLSKASRSVLGQYPIQCARRVLSLEMKRPEREAHEYIKCRGYRSQNLLLYWNERTRPVEIQPEVLAPWHPQKGPRCTFWLGLRGVCVLWCGEKLFCPLLSGFDPWSVTVLTELRHSIMTENETRQAI